MLNSKCTPRIIAHRDDWLNFQQDYDIASHWACATGKSGDVVNEENEKRLDHNGPLLEYLRLQKKHGRNTLLRKGESLGHVAGFSWCGMPTEDQPSKWQSKSGSRSWFSYSCSSSTLHIELRFESTTMEVLGNASGVAQVGHRMGFDAIQVGNMGNFIYWCSSCDPS